MDKLSVIICTYNRGDVIGDCLESLLQNNVEQEFFEILIVDNNSKDNTKEIVNEFCKKNSNIRYVKEEKVGLSHARNKGIIEANGTILAFIDDDVEVSKEYIDSIIKFFDEHPEEVCAGGKIIPVWHFQKPDWFVGDFASIIGETKYGEETCVLKTREYPLGGNMIFKKEIFNEIGYFNTNLGIQGDTLYLGEEVDICDRVLRLEKKIYYLPQAYVYHKVHENKVDKKYILNRLKLEGESVAHWHFDTKTRFQMLIQYVIRMGILILRDYPALMISKSKNSHVFWKECKVARTRAYVKKARMLFSQGRNK
ncbi:glycosyltransferase family 2 protein [Bacillus sp. FDAARGOS_1420]|uniref:glycosyltransferase n=1 Tax=unclassified Bacillus (in: firmicutes) TaxID=185979 RepID=UPI001C5B681E|nr:glycosyltransferase [Bacillus sp. FDAARGOS_1420]MBW3491681.1 glycosyltransferase [Bacillus sp. FDAARGOS_1420]